MTGLTDAQRAHYFERGWLHIPGLLARSDFEPMLAEFDSVIDEMASALKARGDLADPAPELDLRTRLTRLTEQTPLAFRSLFMGVHRGRALFDFLRHPKILDVMESLLGPDIACHPAYRVRPKLPDLPQTARLTVVPWHQDGAYQDPVCDNNLLVTIWVALTESTVENGCLELIDRAHQRMLPHRNVRKKTYLRILGDALPKTGWTPMLAEPGDAVLMCQLTPHRSLRNVTDRIRWSIDMRYHAQGTPTGYPPEAGFLARSRSTPDAVCETVEEFERIRTEHVPGKPWRWRRWPMHEHE